MLDLAVLGLLRDEPHHGYQVRARLQELGFRRISFGALYPALRRLEAKGWIAAVRSPGRRKAYRITDAGIEAFEQLLATDADDGDEARFRMRVAFFAYLAPLQRIRILEKRRSQLVDRLAGLRRTQRRTTPAERYPLALVERSISATESEIAWLDGLVAHERSLAT
jgi:DNA-binding PadR family transcriptional regulator